MRLAIIGTGALASLFAARLTATADVIMIGSWMAQIAAVTEHGLTIHEQDGRRTLTRPRITADPAAAGTVEVVAVIVKSYQTPTAIARIRPLLTPETIIISHQNGLGNVEQLAAAFGRERVTAGPTAQGATMLSPGNVRHAGAGPTTLGALPETSQRLTAYVGALATSGIEAEILPEVAPILWAKAAVNAGINPLTTLLDLPNGALTRHPRARRIVRAAAMEAAAVAGALGIGLPWSDAGAAALAVATATADNISSMLQDRRRGAPLEIEAICGAIVKHGRAVGVATPVNVQLKSLLEKPAATPRQLVVANEIVDIDSLAEELRHGSHH